MLKHCYIYCLPCYSASLFVPYWTLGMSNYTPLLTLLCHFDIEGIKYFSHIYCCSLSCVVLLLWLPQQWGHPTLQHSCLSSCVNLFIGDVKHCRWQRPTNCTALLQLMLNSPPYGTSGRQHLATLDDCRVGPGWAAVKAVCGWLTSIERLHFYSTLRCM